MTESIFPAPLIFRTKTLLEAYRQNHLTLALAESCTGGLVAALLSEIPGSSDVFQGSFVTYSNQAKQTMLGVKVETLATQGAVSQACACEMASGVLANSTADVAVAITGIAGPGGGSALKPVGLVHFASQKRGSSPHAIERRFSDDGRALIRLHAVEQALALFFYYVE